MIICFQHVHVHVLSMFSLTLSIELSFKFIIEVFANLVKFVFSRLRVVSGWASNRVDRT